MLELLFRTILQTKSSAKILNIFFNCYRIINYEYLEEKSMANKKPLFQAPYDIRDVSALFAIVAFILIIAAIVGNNLFGIFQQNFNFG